MYFHKPQNTETFSRSSPRGLNLNEGWYIHTLIYIHKHACQTHICRHTYMFMCPTHQKNPQSNISLLHGHHGQLARHFSSFYLLNQSPHLLFMCYRPCYELFNARGKFTAPVFLHTGCKSTDERKGEREKVVRRERRRRAGGKWPPEGHRLTQATS